VGAYFVRRILIAIPVLLGITMAAFFVLAAAPGDPILARLDPEVRARMTPEQIEGFRRAAGLDQPAPIRYVRWLGDTLQGDFGYSISNGRPVAEEIQSRLGPSLILMSTAIVIALIVGIPFGVISAVNQYGKLDYLLSALTVFLISTPTFVLALVFLYVFGVTLRILPVGDMFTFGKEDDLADRFAHLILPALILGLANAAPLVRYTRTSMLEVLNSEYMTTARSKGLASRRVIVRHGLGNALIPIITLLAVLLPELVAGAVITETVFNWPGLGQLSVKAAYDRDPAMMMGVVLIVGIAVLVSSIVADFAYSVVDPRIRFGGHGNR
jgi:peptide/nickel transport system permease protein